MDNASKEKVKELIETAGGIIQYIYISKKDAFYLMRGTIYPLKRLLYNEEELSIDKFISIFKILHNSKIIVDVDEKRRYIINHRNAICNTPSFRMEEIAEGGYRDIHSQKYLTPIKNLFRDVGLLPEKRGKKKTLSETNKHLRWFLIQEFKAMKKKKTLPMKILQMRLSKETSRLFPDNPKEADKYLMSDATIRRILKPYIKK
ncbi:hypothetical protein ACFL1I_08550 [Candidatus Omnitrophota bacterium]